MERKSPYVLIGAAVLVFVAAVIGFVVWKLRAGDQTSYAYYVIYFSGDVQGLTPDSPVFYRGLRVGRVASIELASRRDIQRSTGRERLSEKILVTVAVDSAIDIRERSYAVFEKPFIAGASYIQIVGRLDVDQVKPKKKLGETPYPEIREGASFLQATSSSAQEVLSKTSVTVDRLNELLSPDNLAAVSDALKNLSTVTGSLAKQDAAIQATLTELPKAIGDFRATFDRMNGLVDNLNLIALELGPQDAETRKALAGKQPSELTKTFTEARAAIASIDSAAGQLNRLLADSQGPVRQFSETGLTEFSLAIRELRQLTANLNVIATKLERDPAGFVFSGKQGYTPK
ncbi:MAG: MCE family protein [Enhydrobacter sp.]|nr:MAG: MCE family protein [Enhydrobacter sp.]